MSSPRSTPRLLARLRASTRLAVLVLLLFGLKIGAAAACVGHDFADLGLGTAGEHSAAMVKVPSGSDTDGERPGTTAAHAATCSHGTCHQAADLTNAPDTHLPSARIAIEVPESGPHPAPAPQNQLRPPIV
jgi:hypothetical protein